MSTNQEQPTDVKASIAAALARKSPNIDALIAAALAGSLGADNAAVAQLAAELEITRAKRDQLQTGCRRLKAALAKKDAPYKTALDGAIKGLERAQRERDALKDILAAQGSTQASFAAAAEIEAAVPITAGAPSMRVTLELTGRFDCPPDEWPWEAIFAHDVRVQLEPGDSVRVVEEAESLDRRHRWDRDGERCLKCNDKDWMGGPCNTTDEEYIEKLTDERDAAIRERDKLRAERITQALTAARFAAAVIEVDTLKARVAALESAAKLAPAANSGAGSNHAAPAASGAAGTEVVAWGVMSSADPPHRVWLHWEQDLAERWARQKQCDYNAQLNVVPLYAAPAASGAAGNSPAVPVSSGPVAWGVKTHDGRFVCAASKSFMESEAEQQRGTLHPLYAAPQAAKGCLTAEERAAIQWAISEGFDEEVLLHLLARSSPPEVVVPDQVFRSHSNALRDAEWFAALAAAVVSWKELKNDNA